MFLAWPYPSLWTREIVKLVFTNKYMHGFLRDPGQFLWFPKCLDIIMMTGIIARL